MGPRLIKLLYRPAVRWAARRKLVGRNRDQSDMSRGRFTKQETADILEQSWNKFDELATSAPEVPSPGAYHNVLLGCLTLVAVEALSAHGIDRHYAIELFGDVAYDIYSRWGAVARLISRSASRDPAQRMRVACQLFLTFPFDKPGYKYETRRMEDGLAFDITRCPIAEYLREHNAADIGLRTWCHQDWALAEYWGGWMERTQTRMEGAEACDFRWRAAR